MMCLHYQMMTRSVLPPASQPVCQANDGLSLFILLYVIRQTIVMIHDQSRESHQQHRRRHLHQSSFVIRQARQLLSVVPITYHAK